jgi:hypothetical protein
MGINAVTPTGLTTKSFQDYLNAILNGEPPYLGLLQIYGPGLNVQPNSPDGNMANIYAQGSTDNTDLIAQVFTSMDPDQAVGVVLNARSALNGIFREGPSFTTVQITVDIVAVATLPGLDLYPNGGAFTVADGSGNQYSLQTTTAVTLGFTNLVMQALQAGPLLVPSDSIITIVTPNAAVTDLTQPLPQLTIGQLEESDSAFRIRRQQQLAAPGRSWYGSLTAQLIALFGINSSEVIENNTPATVGGVPANSIWVIVACPQTPANATLIATAIMIGISAGCGTYGTEAVAVQQPDGNTYISHFDYATLTPIYFRCTITAITGTIDEVSIAQQIFNQFATSYGVNKPADATSIVAFIKSIAPNASVTNEAVSLDNATWVAILNPSSPQKQFYIPILANIELS